MHYLVTAVSVQPHRLKSFRPLIRGLSISSIMTSESVKVEEVSVPSSGDYQFLLEVEEQSGTELLRFRPLIRGLSISSSKQLMFTIGNSRFRPLIRGLSISSEMCADTALPSFRFPSPHPGIINFFSTVTNT